RCDARRELDLVRLELAARGAAPELLREIILGNAREDAAVGREPRAHGGVALGVRLDETLGGRPVAALVAGAVDGRALAVATGALAVLTGRHLDAIRDAVAQGGVVVVVVRVARRL